MLYYFLSLIDSLTANTTVTSGTPGSGTSYFTIAADFSTWTRIGHICYVHVLGTVNTKLTNAMTIPFIILPEPWAIILVNLVSVGGNAYSRARFYSSSDFQNRLIGQSVTSTIEANTPLDFILIYYIQ